MKIRDVAMNEVVLWYLVRCVLVWRKKSRTCLDNEGYKA